MLLPSDLLLFVYCYGIYCFPCGSAGKEWACNAGNLGLIPGLGRSCGGGKGYMLQHSGLENSMGCIVHGVTKSRTRLGDFHFHFHEIYNFILTLSIFFFNFSLDFKHQLLYKTTKSCCQSMKQREAWTASLMTSFLPVALGSSGRPVLRNVILNSVKWKKQRSNTRACSKMHWPLRNPSQSEFKARRLLWSTTAHLAI